ncbi:MAG: YbgA family protein [Nitrospirales bacterium]
MSTETRSIQAKEKSASPKAQASSGGHFDDKPRIGISQCLLGDEVRYDGGHKRDVFLTDVLAHFVEWIPVCPEVEAGLGTPREAMHLAGNPDSPRLLTIRTQVDHTATLNMFSQRRVQELHTSDLDGYIFKKSSPSCGVHRVKVYTEKGQPSKQGTGIFAAAFQQAFPLLPIEEEGRLNDATIRENFVARIFCYRRWKTQVQQQRIRRGIIVDFHTRHKYLLLTHSRVHYDALGKLVAKAGQYTPAELATQYGEFFMEALKVKATVKKHVNVLQHLAGHLKTFLSADERAELQENITDYHRLLTPLTVPLTLIKHYVRTRSVPYLADQVYLNPHPKELMLRNHV